MPGWKRLLPHTAVTAVLRSWLFEQGSLTARCERGCDHFHVRLLRYTTERSLMTPSGAPGRPGVKARDVLLECDGVPVIFAHTELAMRPRGRMTRWVAGLGSRSLGRLLFANPAFRRDGIEVCRLKENQELFQRAASAAGLKGHPVLWARRSTHHLRNQSVIVTEVFLPAILELPGG